MEDLDDFLWRLGRHIMDFMSVQNYGLEPYVEFRESEDSVSLTAELPGIRPDDIRVIVLEDGVRVSVVENGFKMYSGFFRARGLGRDQASITFRNEVLEVTVPRKRTLF